MTDAELTAIRDRQDARRMHDAAGCGSGGKRCMWHDRYCTADIDALIAEVEKQWERPFLDGYRGAY